MNLPAAIVVAVAVGPVVERKIAAFGASSSAARKEYSVTSQHHLNQPNNSNLHFGITDQHARK